MKKEFSVSIIRWCSLIVSVFLMLNLFMYGENVSDPNSFYIPTKYEIVPFIEFAILVAFTIIEYVLKQKPYIRFGIYLLSFIILVVILSTNVNLAAITISIFGILYTIIYLIVTFKQPRRIDDKNFSTYVDPNETLKSKPKLFMFYSKKHKNINIVFISIYILLVAITTILELELKFNFFIYLLILVVIVSLYIITTSLINPLVKLEKGFLKNGDYKSFSLLLNDLASSSTSKEASNYCKIIDTYYAFAYSNELACTKIKEVFKPSNPTYEKTYLLLLARYYCELNDSENALKVANSTIGNNYKIITDLYKIYFTNDTMPMKEKKKSLSEEVLDEYYNFIYYKVRNEETNALKSAQKVINSKTDFEQLKNNCKDYIKSLEIEDLEENKQI